MQISIGGKIIVAVSQPGLDVLEGVTQVQHDGSTAVAEIMKTDMAEAIVLQQLFKFLCDIIRLQQVAHSIHTEEVQIRGVIRGSAEIALILLGMVEIYEVLVGISTQRERAVAAVRRFFL